MKTFYSSLSLVAVLCLSACDTLSPVEAKYGRGAFIINNKCYRYINGQLCSYRVDGSWHPAGATHQTTTTTTSYSAPANNTRYATCTYCGGDGEVTYYREKTSGERASDAAWSKHFPGMSYFLNKNGRDSSKVYETRKCSECGGSGQILQTIY